MSHNKDAWYKFSNAPSIAIGADPDPTRNFNTSRHYDILTSHDRRSLLIKSSIATNQCDTVSKRWTNIDSEVMPKHLPPLSIREMSDWDFSHKHLKLVIDPEYAVLSPDIGDISRPFNVHVHVRGVPHYIYCNDREEKLEGRAERLTLYHATRDQVKGEWNSPDSVVIDRYLEWYSTGFENLNVVYWPAQESLLFLLLDAKDCHFRICRYDLVTRQWTTCWKDKSTHRFFQNGTPGGTWSSDQTELMVLGSDQFYNEIHIFKFVNANQCEARRSDCVLRNTLHRDKRGIITLAGPTVDTSFVPQYIAHILRLEECKGMIMPPEIVDLIGGYYAEPMVHYLMQHFNKRHLDKRGVWEIWGETQHWMIKESEILDGGQEMKSFGRID